MSFALYIGALVYGGFGGGSQETSVAIPVTSDESSYCDVVDRKFFVADDCDGCGGSNPHDWDVQEVWINGGIDGGLKFIWDDGESSYKVEDSDGGEVGWCTWSEPSDSEECEDSLDVYNMANVMECDLDVDVEW